MIDMDEMLETWRPTVQKVARFVSHDFPGVEVDEVESALWEFVTGHADALENPEKAGTVPAMVRAAKDACWKQRKEHLQLSAQYPYRPSDVRVLLDYVFEPERWTDAPVPDDARSLRGHDAIEMAVDVQWAWSRLSDSDKRVIFSAYALDLMPEPKSAASRRLWKSLDRLVAALNSYHGRVDAPATG